MSAATIRTAPRLVTIGGVLSGAAGGLGFVVLLQQFAVAYPTPMLAIVGVVGGILVHIGVVAAAGALAGGRANDAVALPADVPATAEGWMPSHAIPASGLDAWDQPDATSAPAAQLDPGLPVQLLDRHGDWASILCENGWKAWVDGRRLEDPA